MRPFNWRDTAWFALAAVLAIFSLVEVRSESAYLYAFDLYHPWGISASRPSLGPVNPYTDTARLGTFAFEEAGRSSSGMLKSASGYWQRQAGIRFEPTGTPLFYTLLAFVPRDFDVAHVAWNVIQYAALGMGLVGLMRMRGASFAPAACVAALAWAAFRPFEHDFVYANVTSFQFLVLVGFIAFARAADRDRRAAVDLLYLPALTVFVLAKPNVALVALALAGHYALTRGTRRLTLASALAVVALVGGLAAAAAYFRDIDVWRDWYRYTQGLNAGRLLYTAREGNVSFVKMLAENGAGYGPMGWSVLVALALATALLVAVSDAGRRPRDVVPALTAMLTDPWLAASAGVIATFAVSPLVWHHYFVLALIPMARLFRWRGRWDAATTCVALAIVGMLRPPVAASVNPELIPGLYVVMKLAWMPLLPALLIEAARIRRGLHENEKGPAALLHGRRSLA